MQVWQSKGELGGLVGKIQNLLLKRVQDKANEINNDLSFYFAYHSDHEHITSDQTGNEASSVWSKTVQKT